MFLLTLPVLRPYYLVFANGVNFSPLVSRDKHYTSFARKEDPCEDNVVQISRVKGAGDPSEGCRTNLTYIRQGKRENREFS